MSLSRTFSSEERTEALYAIPANVEIRLRIKSENPGEWILIQTPTSPRPSEHFYAGRFEVDSEWKEFVLHRQDIRPYKDHGTASRDLVPEVEIGSFAINGFGTGKIFLDWFVVSSQSPPNDSSP
jgi:hypothetical protein